MREIVRRSGDYMTHLADVESTTAIITLGVTYRRVSDSTKALCGETLKDGVVMRPGTKMKCQACAAVELAEPRLTKRRVRAAIRKRGGFFLTPDQINTITNDVWDLIQERP